MTYIFLSYAKADRDAAFAMRDVLRREGLSNVWMDENFHELNEQHWPIIETNILSAGAFIVLLSDAAKESKWVQREWVYAKQIQKPIYTILIQGEAWSGLQEEPLRPSLGASLDLPDDFAARLKKLDTPYASLPEQIPSDTVKPPRSIFKPRNLIIGALVLAVLLTLIRLALQSIERQADAKNFSMTLTAPFAQSTAIALNQQNTQAAELGLTRDTRETLQANMTTTAAVRVLTRTQAPVLSLEEIEASMTAWEVGSLPCEASPIESENFSLYFLPSVESGESFSFPSDGLRLRITALMMNNEGRWYYVQVIDSSYAGYVPGEAIQLDEDCPR